MKQSVWQFTADLVLFVFLKIAQSISFLQIDCAILEMEYCVNVEINILYSLRSVEKIYFFKFEVLK